MVGDGKAVVFVGVLHQHITLKNMFGLQLEVSKCKASKLIRYLMFNFFLGYLDVPGS